MRRDWQVAVQEGNIARIASLILAGADVNAKDRYGQTALMLSARDGFTDVVQILLQNDAELDTTAKYNLSALMLAAVNGHSDVVKELVKAKAEIDTKGSGAPGFHDKTAYDLAVAMGNHEIADLIARTARHR